MPLPIHVLARAVIIDQAHILLCRHIPVPARPCEFYFLPGGHVEGGEGAENAVKRELREETGFDFEITRFLGCLEFSFKPESPEVCHSHEYNFIFHAQSSVVVAPTPIPQMEQHIECVWVALDTMRTLDFRPDKLKQLIPEWLTRDVSSAFQSEMLS